MAQSLPVLPSRLEPPLLARLARGPAAVSRSSRRLSRTGRFVLETAAHVAANPEPDPNRRARRLSWIGEQLCALHGIEVVSRGPIPRTPAVLVANHSSYIDPIALVSQVPALPIAKREVRSWPMVGDVMGGLGVLFVEREDAHSGVRVLRQSIRYLDAGASILAFPEGTTTVGDDVLPFRRGVFGAARLTGRPIVPVTVRYESADPCWVGDAPFLPHYVMTTARPRTRVQLIFGAPIDPAPWTCAEALALEARVRIRATLLDG